MAVDFLRSCYECDWVFFRDGTTTRVRWYFTDKPPLPFPHRFGSTNWLGEGEDPGPLGEIVYAPRKWVNGASPSAAPGDHWCGTRDMWINGLAVPPVPPVEKEPDGSLKCCYKKPVPGNPFFGSGGQQQGGDSWVITGLGGQRQGGDGEFFYPASAGQQQGGAGLFYVVSQGGQRQGGSGLWPWLSVPDQLQGGAGMFPFLSYAGSQQQGGAGLWPWLSGAASQQQGGAGQWTWDVPIEGEVVVYGGTTLPTGYLACDGSAVSRTTYANLFAAIGTTWGAGNGTTTFNVPDLRGRAPLGSGTGTGLSARTVGQTGGAETHLLTTAETPAHTHAQDAATMLTGGAVIPAGTLGAVLKTGGTTGSTGGGGTHNNMQPWACLQFIIKT